VVAFLPTELLGTPQQYMIGNVIQSRYLELADYPTAAALSFILMALMIAIVLVWARVAGTEALLGTEEGRS
jgi:spermidine/putrescine transport system permease protein